MPDSEIQAERRKLINQIGQLAETALIGVDPKISRVRQRPFPIPRSIVQELWLGRSNLSGVSKEPPMVNPGTLTVTELDLASFLGTRIKFPKIVTVELGLEADPDYEVRARYWHYGIRLGWPEEPKYVLHAVGKNGPKPLNALETVVSPLSEEFQDDLRIKAHNADLKAFRDFLVFVAN